MSGRLVFVTGPTASGKTTFTRGYGDTFGSMREVAVFGGERILDLGAVMQALEEGHDVVVTLPPGIPNASVVNMGVW